MPYRVLVVGLGNVGMGYDLELPFPEYVLTHARAFHRHAAFDLVAGVDERAEQRSTFERHFGSPAMADLEDAVRRYEPDVVALAVPTNLHGSMLKTVLRAGRPRAILCEKPLADDVEEAERMARACVDREVGLLVNFSRRSEPGALEVKRRVCAGEIRQPLKGVVWYSKGLFNTASHFVNLLEDWLGPVAACDVLDEGSATPTIAGDPEPDVRLRFASGSDAYLLAVDEHEISHRCLELVGPSGRLRYESEGTRIEWSAAAADPIFAGYRVVSGEVEVIPTDAYRSLWHVVDQLAKALAGRPAAICTAADALATSRTLASIDAHLGTGPRG